MRENMGLYRGKTLDTGEWVIGSIISYNRNDGGLRSAIITGFAPLSKTVDCVAVDPATVCQFTGLYDKNGKRIFEGDVVATATGKPHEVMFADGEFFMDGASIPIKWICKFEVIGNVHDNPELKGEC